MIHLLSVDVEDYHDQLALDFQDRIIPPNDEAVGATDHMLELFAEHGVRGTFFILGEIAESFPALVRRIAEQGHHLGVHGYYHLHIFRQSPSEFRQSIERAKKLIEDVAGAPANAHRAISFSIVESTMWAVPILVDLGFVYDSSIFPMRMRRYGIPGSPRGPYRFVLPDGRSIWEVPMTTFKAFGRLWPACGGGYLRLFPFAYNDYVFRTLDAAGCPVNSYLHPYELVIDPEIEALPGLSRAERIKFDLFNWSQVVGRKTVEGKLRRLLSRYRFGTLPEVVAAYEASGASIIEQPVSCPSA